MAQAAMGECPSSKRVQKAGSKLRKHFRGDAVLDSVAFQAEVDCITRWRASFSGPLVSTNNSLRSALRRRQIDGQVTQRLKRMSTIIDKLQREPTLSLERMRDIGGCRVVVSTLDEVYEVSDWLHGLRPIVEVKDYIKDPRDSGYRALHVVATYGGAEPRPIEIQIRTKPMHRWALLVEEQSSTQGVNYKQDGDSRFHHTMREVSTLVSEHESEQNLPEVVVELLRELGLLD